MAYVLSDNILSPLGATSEANYRAVKQGQSALKAYAAEALQVPEPFVASLLADADNADAAADNAAADNAAADTTAAGADRLSHFERMALASAREALAAADIDASASDVVLVLASTKGGVEQMHRHDDPYPRLGASARRIAGCLGITTSPVVVCNACISGVAALVLADRLLQGPYRYAVVCGADSPRRFVISGFQSLKALSAEPCRPFDMERTGLNLGEAAATVVLGREPRDAGAWMLTHGAVKNDAYHISAPSKTADGLHHALCLTLQGVDRSQVAFVNAHGTATLFNDQMESVAMERAGLTDTPVNALKGYYGHTLGAAGILETILCMKAADDHTVLATRGFSERGVSGRVQVMADQQTTDKPAFVKLISGFGGCNATLLGTRQSDVVTAASCGAPCRQPLLRTTHTLLLTPHSLTVDGRQQPLPAAETGRDLLTALYKSRIADYPKYYKMDALSRLGFVASELLLQAEGTAASGTPRSDRAVLLFNRSSSCVADRRYLQSIEDAVACFPSPSVFVYTLPNIVTGEIAIRHAYRGETSFYVLDERDDRLMRQIIESAFLDSETQSVLTGWIDCDSEDQYVADLQIMEVQA